MGLFNAGELQGAGGNSAILGGFFLSGNIRTCSRRLKRPWLFSQNINSYGNRI
jgi:hypothetical protein